MVAHANQSVFGADANKFRPQRWLENEEKTRRMEQYSLTVSLVPIYATLKSK